MRFEVGGLKKRTPLSRKRSTYRRFVLSAFMSMIILLLPCLSWGAIGGRDGIESYFAQGQAIAHESDQALSRKDAIYNLQVQAVTQAAAVFFSPSQMVAGFEDMYRDILSRPEKYVQNYQIFTELPLYAGLYKVTGVVSVSLDLLRGDFVRLGFLGEGAPRRTAREEELAVAPLDKPIKEPEEFPMLPVEDRFETPSEIAKVVEITGDGSIEVLWAVAEKWNGGHRLPAGANDLDVYFSPGVMQESHDYAWKISFPDRVGFLMGEAGEVDSNAALQEAVRRGMARMVLGKVFVTHTSSGKKAIHAHLRVFEVPSGRLQGEFREMLTLDGLTMGEGALRMAVAAVPRLDALFNRTRVQWLEDKVQPELHSELQSSVEPLVTELLIVSSNSFADWLELEKLLREKAPDVAVSSLELGQGGTIVRLTGTNAFFIQEMDGTPMMDGLLLKVELEEPYENKVRVTFEPALPPVDEEFPGDVLPEDAEVEKAP